MPYAADNYAGTDPVPGSIYITFEQYQEAIEAMTSGLEIRIIDGVMTFVPVIHLVEEEGI